MTTRNPYAAGWDLFKQSKGTISLGAINAVLAASEMKKISIRMHQHYGNMFKTGHRGKYVPINKFDVAREGGVWVPNA